MPLLSRISRRARLLLRRFSSAVVNREEVVSLWSWCHKVVTVATQVLLRSVDQQRLAWCCPRRSRSQARPTPADLALVFTSTTLIHALHRKLLINTWPLLLFNRVHETELVYIPSFMFNYCLLAELRAVLQISSLVLCMTLSSPVYVEAVACS